jgi:hypothetical protein
MTCASTMPRALLLVNGRKSKSFSESCVCRLAYRDRAMRAIADSTTEGKS